MCFIKDFSTKILLLSTYILKKVSRNHHVPFKQIKSSYLKVSYDLRLSDRLSRRERNVSLRNSSPFDAGTKVVLQILHDIINDNKSIVKRVIIKSSKLFLRFVSFTIVYLRKNNYREMNHGKISIDIVRSIVSRKSSHPFQFSRIPRTPKNPNPPVESDKLPGTSSSTVEKG